MYCDVPGVDFDDSWDLLKREVYCNTTVLLSETRVIIMKSILKSILKSLKLQKTLLTVSISGSVFTNLELKNNQRAWCLRECLNCLNLSINLLASSVAIYNVRRNPNVCGFGMT